MGAQHAVAHGALDHAELAALGLRPETLLDFSSNINPFGPPPEVRAALAALDPAPYPDRSCLRLRLALAQRHGCTPEHIVVGNGSNELIQLIARALLRPGDSTLFHHTHTEARGIQQDGSVGQVVLVVEPTFGEYSHACQLVHHESCVSACLRGEQLPPQFGQAALVTSWRAEAANNFQVDAAEVSAAIRHQRPRLTWICAPNNPTGVDLADDMLGMLAEECAAVGGYLVVDRAYHSFRPGFNPLYDTLDGLALPNLLLLHSLTKSYALAGLRLGYLLGEEALIRQIAALQPTWSVNSAAQAAGLAALDNQAFLAVTLPQLWASSDNLCAALRGLGLSVWRDRLPFMLVHTGDGAATRTALLRRGMLVRDCASFGLPAYVRIAPRSLAENTALLDSWKELA